MVRIAIGWRLLLAGLVCCLATRLGCGDEKKPTADSAGFVQLFNGKDLTGWKTHEKNPGDWKVEEGILIGRGPVSHLFSERGDYKNFIYRMEAKISDEGNSGQYIRADFAGGFPPGYEAQINSTHRDPIRTGSLYPDGRDKYTPEEKEKMIVKEMLVKPDEWFTQEVIARGNHIIIKVNGKTTVDFVDAGNRHTKGHFAIQQHNLGSVIQVRKIEVKELPEGDK